MSDEPTFPADAFGKGPETVSPPKPAATPQIAPDRAVAGGGETPAEVVATVETVKNNLWPAAGVAIGIGSAAIAAALLYRSRR